MIVQFQQTFAREGQPRDDLIIGINHADIPRIEPIWFYEGGVIPGASEIFMRDGKSFQVKGNPKETIDKLKDAACQS
jgi:hypothetical protein